MYNSLQVIKMKETITIIHTSDIHGYITPINYANNQKEHVGLAKIASKIKSSQDKNTILIDSGDTIQGSPMMYMHQKHLSDQIQPMAKVMNALKYDYYIPGNHDFNYGKDYLKSFTNQINAKTLCANITSDQDTLYFQKAFDIFESKKGIKLAIIGLTTEYIPNWEQEGHIENLKFHSVIKTLKETLSEIKNFKVHAIIVAYHGGFEKDLDTFEPVIKDTKENVGSAIIEACPEIDVLLTGHQHRKINRKINGIIVSQPGSKGESFSTIDLHFKKHKKWTLSESNITLHQSSDFQADEGILELIAPEENYTQNKLNEVIAYSQDDSFIIHDQIKARIDKHPLVTLINDIQLKVSGAQISAMSLANDSTGFGKEITIRNILSTYPFPNTLAVVKITGKELKEVLEENAQYFTIKDNEITVSDAYSNPKVQHYNYDMFDGIEYTIKVSNPLGQRIVSLTRFGQTINPKDTFSLVINNYRAAGGGDFLTLKKLEVIKEIPTNVSSLMIEYIQAQKIIKPINMSNIKVIQ